MKTIKIGLMLLIGIVMLACTKQEPVEEAGFPPVDWSVIQWGPSWIPFDTNLLHIDTPKTTPCYRGKRLYQKDK